jgi:hypothetical protein
MLDPVIKEIRRMRLKRSEELARDPVKAREETERKVLAMATHVVQTGPHTYRATFNIPTEPKKKPKKRRN